MIPGIDVSHWQNDKSTPQKMDFKKAKEAGAQFVFIKVSERGGIDQDFIYNWQAAKDAGLPRGGYHFLRWDLSGLMQARIFCNILKDDPGELPPVADYEAPPLGSLYPSNALLMQFLEEVETSLSRRPIIYTSPGYWSTHGRNKTTGRFDAKWAYFPLWIAHYFKVMLPTTRPIVPEPWKSNTDWTFWQYSATGDGKKFGAESKGIDMNYFNGDMLDWTDYLQRLNPGIDPPSAPGSGSEKPPNTGDIPYLQAQIDLVASRVKGLEDWIKGYKS